eukprot:2569683-Pleurochrysis_carterae.AAC.1
MRSTRPEQKLLETTGKASAPLRGLAYEHSDSPLGECKAALSLGVSTIVSAVRSSRLACKSLSRLVGHACERAGSHGASKMYEPLVLKGLTSIDISEEMKVRN